MLMSNMIHLHEANLPDKLNNNVNYRTRQTDTYFNPPLQLRVKRT